MTPFPYRVTVRWSEADEAYVAEVPAIRGASGDGETAEEAVRAAQECAAEMIEVKNEHGDPIPASDTAEPEFSGQLRLRMPRSLHRELAAAAERESVSLNQLLVTFLAKQLGADSSTQVAGRVDVRTGSEQPGLASFNMRHQALARVAISGIRSLAVEQSSAYYAGFFAADPTPPEPFSEYEVLGGCSHIFNSPRFWGLVTAPTTGPDVIEVRKKDPKERTQESKEPAVQ